MGDDKLNASGFEFYEGIRIAVPGAIVVALYVAINATFHLGAPKPDALLGLIVAVGVGLVLYYAELSSRAQVYLAAQPHRIIEGWQLHLPNGVSAMNVYFVVLDAVMPAGIRNRALYFGSIFRIGFETIYLTALAAIGVLTVSIVTTSPIASRATDVTVLWLALPLHLLVAATGIWEGYSLALRREKTARAAIRQVTHRLAQQVGFTGAILLGAGALALGARFTIIHWSGMLVAGIALPTSLWALRYLHGYRRRDTGERRNIDPATATTLLTVPTVLVTVLAATQASSHSVLGTAAALGWSGVALVAELLVARRGHERRLWAAFHTQRTWLELNRTRVTELVSTPEHPSPG